MRSTCARALHRDLDRSEHLSGELTLDAQETQQDVLAPDVVVLESPRFLLRQGDNATGLLCEPLERQSSLDQIHTAVRQPTPIIARQTIRTASRRRGHEGVAAAIDVGSP